MNQENNLAGSLPSLGEARDLAILASHADYLRAGHAFLNP